MEQKRRFAVSLLLIAVLPLCAHSFPFTEENPIAYGKVKIQSWKARAGFQYCKAGFGFFLRGGFGGDTFEQFLRARAGGRIGSKYDKAIEEMLEYSGKLDPNSFKTKKIGKKL